MQIKPTKTLESVFAAAIREAGLRSANQISSDHLLLGLLKQEGGHGLYVLQKLLQEWELYQIRLRMEHEAGALLLGGERRMDAVAKSVTIDELIRQIYDKSQRADGAIHTGDLLRMVLSDPRSHGARVLALYHVTPDTVRPYLDELPPNEDYYEEMHYLSRLGKADADGAIEPVANGEVRVAVESVPKSSKESLLVRYGVDLTAKAEAGEIDPVVGRDVEIERMIQILGRRKKNNPVLIGEAGVGKSAVAEGLALRIARRTVPQQLAPRRIFALNVASLVAGTKFRGEFEERIGKLLAELKREDYILFIDELHTIVGAGATQGALDAANLLKPALARGEIQCIGATTLAEYRQYIESDSALERRFQQILVEEPSAEQTLAVLRGLSERYQHHHGVRYSEEVLEACVQLSQRYMSSRCFPDKAIDLLDESGSRARIRFEQSVTMATQVKHMSQDKRWKRCELKSQPVEVDMEDVVCAVSAMTGIAVPRTDGSEYDSLQHLEKDLSEHVVGQNAAVGKVARAILRSRAGLGDPNRPVGVFLFAGPTGVGKTLVAKELARVLFGNQEAMIRMDMSEYAEPHTVSRLVGSPPGYVGYGEGGQLTEQVRRHPYSVVLFDEIEKAHSDIYNLMLQLFDEGRLTDGAGRKIDFRHTIIIMTSNVGAREIAERPAQVGFKTDSHSIRSEQAARCRKSLERQFAPEFLNRIDDVVQFGRIGKGDLLHIVDLELKRLTERVTHLGYTVRFEPAVRRFLAEEGFVARYGVRSLKRAVSEWIEDPLADRIVSGELQQGGEVAVACRGGHIHLTVTLRDDLPSQQAS